MKILSLLALILFSMLLLKAQASTQENPQQFDESFSQIEDKGNLIILRDFLDSKDLEYDKLKSELQRYIYIDAKDSSLYSRDKKSLDQFLSTQNKKDKPFQKHEVDMNIQNICKLYYAVDTIVDNRVKKPVYYIDRAISNIEYYISNIDQKSRIERSIDNINKDRAAAAKAIQKIYNVENGNQEYKTKISLYYAIIIFVLIVVSFLFLFIKSSAEIGNDFLNGNGLQFIALFAIIISTILFGILGILEGKELAAILSGIAGFILGKGLNVNLTRNIPKDTDNSNA